MEYFHRLLEALHLGFSGPCFWQSTHYYEAIVRFPCVANRSPALAATRRASVVPNHETDFEISHLKAILEKQRHDARLEDWDRLLKPNVEGPHVGNDPKPLVGRVRVRLPLLLQR